MNMLSDSQWGGQIQVMASQISELEKENTRLREALEFYSDTNNWEHPLDYFGDEMSSEICKDNFGDRARKALEGEK